MNRYATSKLLGTRNSTYTRNKGISFYNVSKYPVIPLSDNDIYAITEWGDRFDNLAFQIRIPQNIGAILDNYKSLNR